MVSTILQEVDRRLQLGPGVGSMVRDSANAPTVNHRAGRLPGARVIHHSRDIRRAQIIEYIVSEARSEVKIGLIAKRQRVTQRHIIVRGERMRWIVAA